MSLFLADVARDALLTFLQTNLPGQIDALNAERSGKNPLQQIATWTASPLVATPEPPAIGVLMQTSGFRGTQLVANLDEQHLIHVYIQQGNQDEELLEQDLIGYTTAIVRCVIRHLQGLASLASGAQLLFGDGSGATGQEVVFGPSQPAAGSLFYKEAIIALTVFLSETP